VSDIMSNYPTKQEYISVARTCGLDWTKFGSIFAMESFIFDVERMDDTLFEDWFKLKAGDRFLAVPGESMELRFAETLEFKHHGDWYFEGDKNIAYFEDSWTGYIRMNCFRGIAK